MHTLLSSVTQLSSSLFIVLFLLLLGYAVSYLTKNKSRWQKSFRRTGKGSIEQERLLSIGLLNADPQGLFTDSQAGDSKMLKQAFETIQNDWNIKDETRARSVIAFLTIQGFRGYYPSMLPLAMVDIPDGKRAQIFEASTKSDDESIVKRVNHLAHAIKVFRKGAYADFFSDKSLYKGILAFDMSLLVFLARMANASGYISEHEACESIDFAYEQCSQRYNSWEEVAHANAIGSAVLNDTQQTTKMLQLAKKALNSPDSPWVRIPFRP